MLRGSTPLLFVMEKELIRDQACFENSASLSWAWGSRPPFSAMEMRIGIGAEPDC